MTGQDQYALQDLNASTESTITFMASGSPDTDREKDLMLAVCNSNIEEWKQEQKSASGTNTTKKKNKKNTHKAYRTKRRGDFTIEMMNALGPEEKVDIMLEHKELTGDIEPKDVPVSDDEGDAAMEPHNTQRSSQSKKTDHQSALRERTRPPTALQKTCTKCQKQDIIENMWECINCKA